MQQTVSDEKYNDNDDSNGGHNYSPPSFVRASLIPRTSLRLGQEAAVALRGDGGGGTVTNDVVITTALSCFSEPSSPESGVWRPETVS